MVVRTEFTGAGQHVVQFSGHDDELAEHVTGYVLAAAGEETCRLHGEVVGLPDGFDVPAAADVPGAVRSFTYAPGAPAAARHFAVSELCRWGMAESSELAGDAALVVTELAANAIVHARSGFTLALWAHQDVLRISVRDGSPLPRPEDGPALPPTALHGLGAVDALAGRWGVEPLGSAGKTVWVDLRRL